MSDVETLALLAEEAEFIKGELALALDSLADEAADFSRLIAIVETLEETILAVGLDGFTPMTQWILKNIQHIESTQSDTQTVDNTTIVGELLAGWLSSLVGLCSVPDNAALRENFQAALERREWPVDLDQEQLLQWMELFGDADQTTILDDLADWGDAPEEAVQVTSKEVEVDALETLNTPVKVDLRPSEETDPRDWERFVLESAPKAMEVCALLKASGGKVDQQLADSSREIFWSVKEMAAAVGITPVAELTTALADVLQILSVSENSSRGQQLVVLAIEIVEYQLAHISDPEAPEKADPANLVQQIAAFIKAQNKDDKVPESETETEWVGSVSQFISPEMIAENTNFALDLEANEVPELDNEESNPLSEVQAEDAIFAPKAHDVFVEETDLEELVEESGVEHDADADDVEQMLLDGEMQELVESEGLVEQVSDQIKIDDKAPDEHLEEGELVENPSDLKPTELSDDQESSEKSLSDEQSAITLMDKTDLALASDIDPRLLEAFFMETPGLVTQLVELLRKSTNAQLQGEQMLEAQRLAHTIKGACSFVALDSIYDLVYPLEEALEGLDTNPAAEKFSELLLEVADVLEFLFVCIIDHEAEAPINIIPVMEKLWVWAKLLNPQDEESDLEDDDCYPSTTELEEVALEPVQTVDVRPDVTDIAFSPDVDPRLLEAFFMETPGQVTQLVEMLRNSGDGQLQGAEMLEAQRMAHTIKGACSFVGLTAIYDLASPLEESLEGLDTSPASAEFADFLMEVADVLEFIFECVNSHETEASIDILPFTEKMWVWAKLLNPQDDEDEDEEDFADSMSIPAQQLEQSQPVSAEPVADSSTDSPDNTKLEFSSSLDPAQLEPFYLEVPGQVTQLVELMRESMGNRLAEGKATELLQLVSRIKNASESVGLVSIVELAYPLEVALEALGSSEPPSGFIDTLVEVADIFEFLFQCVLEKETSAPLDSSPFAEQLWTWADDLDVDDAEPVIEAPPTEDSPEEDGGAEPGAKLEEAFTDSKIFGELPDFGFDVMGGGSVNTTLDPDLDPQLREAFFLETPDQVAQLAEMLRSSADGKLVGEQVAEAQRLAHTIKGACAMTGLMEIRDLAHQLEDVMEYLGAATPPPELCDLLIEIGDIFEGLFDAIQAGDAEADIDLEEILEGITEWAGRLSGEGGEELSFAPEILDSTPDIGETNTTLDPELDPQLAEAFFMETPDQVAELAVLLRSSERGGMIGGLVLEAQRLAHSVKGACALVGLRDVEQFTHRLEDVMEGLGEQPPSAELAELFVEVADALEAIFDGVLAQQATVPVGTDLLIAQLDKWAAKLIGIDEEEHEDESGGAQGDITAEDLLWDENVDPNMLDEFFIEVPSQTKVLCTLITEKKIQQEEVRLEAARLAGSVEHWSRTVGIHPVRRIGQNLKNIFLAPRLEEFSEVALAVLKESADLLENLVDAIQGKGDPDPEAGEKIRDLAVWATRVVDAAKDRAIPAKAAAPVAAKKDATAKASTVAAESSLRVPTSRIIDLMRLVGEMTTAVAQLQSRLGPVLEYVSTIRTQGVITGQKLAELETLVEIRSIAADEETEDFDPLEMDQYHELHGIASALNEAFLDGQEIAKLAEGELVELSAAAYRQERLSHDVNEAVLATRMIPVSVLVPRLERTVREACRAAGKKAKIFVEGDHLLADTDIISGLRDALMHMLRNSVDHGIELPKDREAKGKMIEGRLDISFMRQGNTIQIKVSDDGAGFNLEKIKESAVKRGVEVPDDMPDHELLRLVLMPGFSTKQNVTTLSGRGIGMDVVRSSVEQLGGTMTLHNREVAGAETIIRLPLTLVSAPVLLVRIQQQVFALPSDDVNQILYPDESSIYPVDEGWIFRLGDQEYRIRSMASLLGRGDDTEELKNYLGKTVLLIRDENGFQSVLLDQALESRDVVVQPLGPWMESVTGVIGACILATGEVAPILDMRVLLTDRYQHRTDDLERSYFENYFAQDKDKDKVPMILVVDDSLSARKSLEIAVEAAEYDVVTAIDGLDAIRVLADVTPDLILSDMEMPNMNGLELTTHVRSQATTADIPMVMITSRSTRKHRQRAMAVGVTHYLTKPFDQRQLHEVMKNLLGLADA